MKTSDFFRKTCVAAIGAIEFAREKLPDLQKALEDSFDEFVERGERLNEEEDSLADALLAALKMKPKPPTADEVAGIIPGYDDLPVGAVVEKLDGLTPGQLTSVRDYEKSHRKRITILRAIERHLSKGA